MCETGQETCLTCDVSLSLCTPFTDTDWFSVVWSRLVLRYGTNERNVLKTVKNVGVNLPTAYLAAESCMWLSVRSAASSAGGGVGGRRALSSSSRLLCISCSSS